MLLPVAINWYNILKKYSCGNTQYDSITTGEQERPHFIPSGYSVNTYSMKIIYVNRHSSGSKSNDDTNLSRALSLQSLNISHFYNYFYFRIS